MGLLILRTARKSARRDFISLELELFVSKDEKITGLVGNAAFVKKLTNGDVEISVVRCGGTTLHYVSTGRVA